MLNAILPGNYCFYNGELSATYFGADAAGGFAARHVRPVKPAVSQNVI